MTIDYQKLNVGQLPNTLSALLRVAIDDANGLNRRKYVPEAILWHVREYGVNPRCQVCLAGAVMAGTLGIDETQNVNDIYDDTDFSYKYYRNHMSALDELRQGDVACAVQELIGGDYWDYEHLNRRVRYSEFEGWREFNAFLREMETLYDDLVEAGL